MLWLYHLLVCSAHYYFNLIKYNIDNDAFFQFVFEHVY